MADSSTPEKNVPPVPHKSKVLTDQGFLTPVWAGWFRQVFKRIGGNIALSNTELEDIQLTDVAPLAADVALLESTVATHTNKIAANSTNINDILQGPHL